jgi:class 3 adenylate cyclase
MSRATLLYGKGTAMAQTRKLAAILAADVAGYSKLAGADEERTLVRMCAFWSDLIDPTIAAYHGRLTQHLTWPALIPHPSHGGEDRLIGDCSSSARAVSTRASIGVCPNCESTRFASVRC